MFRDLLRHSFGAADRHAFPFRYVIGNLFDRRERLQHRCRGFRTDPRHTREVVNRVSNEA